MAGRFRDGLGIATADAFYAGCAAFGVAALSSLLVAWQTPLRLAGGAVLIYLGVRSVLTASSTGAASSARRERAAARCDLALRLGGRAHAH